MEAQQINITLGTAGHIDHGKTALVKLLTGCETDRLKEEKERGMSIELGFAPCSIAGKEVGIVDVPGHEHFIKTMVAGATGIDGVILVVAADDGIMPQTREHLDILTLLGIKHGVVALTKIDRAAAEHIELVKADLQKFLRGTFLEGAPVLPISNITGEGFDGFYAGLTNLISSMSPKSVAGVFRLPVERAFSVKGYGTVISGIPVAGEVSVGDEVVLLPGNLSGRVNAVQVYGRDAREAKAGQCAAVNIRHWDHRMVSRGNVLTVEGYFTPEQWYLCRLRVLPNDNAATRNGARVKFHTGTSEVPATIYLLDAEAMRPGDEGFVQVRLDSPVTAGPMDAFIVRRLSPPATIGGGTIIEAEPQKIKRNRPGLREELDRRAWAAADEKSFVEYALGTAHGYAATAADIARRVKIPQARLSQLLSALAAEGKVRDFGQGLYAHGEVAAQEGRRLAGILAAHHRTSPQAAGMEIEKLLDASGLAKPVFEGLLSMLKAAGTVGEARGLVSLMGHKATLSESEHKLVERVESLFRGKLFNPPSIEEAASSLALARPDVEKAVRILKESGGLIEIAPEMFFHSDAIERAKAAVVAHIEKEGKLESVKFKYLIDTTRKYAIPLLDYFDKVGVTLRVGNTRYLKGR